MRQYRSTAHGKHRYADGGTVNPTQKAVGPTIFQAAERKQRAAIDNAESADTAASAPTSRGGFFNGPPKQDTAKNAAKLQQLLKKRDAEVD